VIEAAQFITDHYEVIARVMIKNITDSPYYELIEIKQYEDGEFEKEINDRHVIDMDFDEETRQLTLKRNDDLPDLTAEIPQGEQVQSDWEEADTENPAFIKNKPEVLNGEDGEDAYVYVAYASDNTGSDFSLTPSDFLKYRAEIHITEELDPPTKSNFSAATWVKYIGDDGSSGDPGDPGQSTYTYVAYASDDLGSDFSLTASDTLKYRAEIHVTTELDPPTESDFSAASWVKYLGDDGEDGQDADDSFDVYIDFVDTDELEFMYNCPAALKFTQQISENSDATLNPVLNTNMAQFDKLTVTAAEVGLIILKGELL
jgi:hypothetical protein